MNVRGAVGRPENFKKTAVLFLRRFNLRRRERGAASLWLTRRSISLVTRSASSSLPLAISQRGLSGMRCRMNQTKIAPTDPRSTTQRQPSNPQGRSGTRRHATKATTGTAEN